MIRNGFPAMLAALVITTASASAQTAIQVEESTGSRTSASPGAPINIALPRSSPTDIQLTTAPLDRSARPEVDDSGSIDLTPAQFRARRQQDLPVTPPAQTTATATTDADSTPAQERIAVPVMPPEGTPAPVAEQTTATEDMSEPAPGPQQDQTTEAVDYLPSADLGGESTIDRGDHRVPMLPSEISPAPLDMTVPDVFETTLTNGMRFYHYQSTDLPRVRINLIIDAGENADPADKVGLADLTAKTLRSGGAAGKSGDRIDEEIDQIGSDLDIAIERDHVAVSLFALTDRTSAATSLLADILTKPELDKTRFEQEKARALEKLRRQNDNPSEISRREYRKLIYGADYPLARTPTSATLENITLDDVRAFYETHYRPSSIWIGVSGDITRDEARSLVESSFAEWDRPAAERVAVPPAIADTHSSPGVYLTRKATAQSQIRMGHLGIERRSEKAYAVNVLNSVYGMGGFSSRLMNVVRTKFGYVYGVGGGVLSDDPAGMFLAAAASQSATTIAAINEMLKVTREIVENGITEEELTTAKRDVTFNFMSQFETPQKIIMAYMLHDFRGYAPDYLARFPERIRAVTLQEVAEVAKEVMHPENIVIYVVGNPDALDGDLSTLGPVHEWELDEYTAPPGD